MFLGHKELPKHASGEKCWDFQQLYEAAEPVSRDDNVVDLGYNGLHTITFLEAIGFRNIYGMDLRYCPEDRLRMMMRMWRRRTCKRPYRLSKGDIAKMKFPAAEKGRNDNFTWYGY